eukprot:TRINITY_DN14326_c0_g2_i1.p1 TRINITY_DN14326_c0_g2~~TRINITY_DN14326_c0_g2_i1.p1  ORF type:complete len:722 (+),score=164.91 TRINITY_DN14326_c0_g2_i1:303-2468(+)
MRMTDAASSKEEGSSVNPTDDYFRNAWAKTVDKTDEGSLPFSVKGAPAAEGGKRRGTSKASSGSVTTQPGGMAHAKGRASAGFGGQAGTLHRLAEALDWTGDSLLDAGSEKDRGNELFKAKQYEEAIGCYTRSIALQPTAVALANRAMAALKLKRYKEVEDDCNHALGLDDTYVKAYQRRGTARMQLKKFEEALEDYECALLLDPSSTEIQKQLEEVLRIVGKSPGGDKTSAAKGQVQLPSASSAPSPALETSVKLPSSRDSQPRAGSGASSSSTPSTSKAKASVTPISTAQAPITSNSSAPLGSQEATEASRGGGSAKAAVLSTGKDVKKETPLEATAATTATAGVAARVTATPARLSETVTAKEAAATGATVLREASPPSVMARETGGHVSPSQTAGAGKGVRTSEVSTADAATSSGRPGLETNGLVSSSELMSEHSTRLLGDGASSGSKRDTEGSRKASGSGRAERDSVQEQNPPGTAYGETRNVPESTPEGVSKNASESLSKIASGGATPLVPPGSASGSAEPDSIRPGNGTSPTEVATPAQSKSVEVAKDGRRKGGAGTANAAAEAATALAVSRAARIAKEAILRKSGEKIKSAYELEALWKGMGDDRQAKAQLLERVKPQELPQVLKDALSPMLLIDMLQTILDTSYFVPGEKAELACDLLENLPRVPRFGMAAMCCSKGEKEGLRTSWAAAISRSQDQAIIQKRLRDVQGLYRL